MTAAQLNLPFCIATLLLEGDVFVEQFSQAAIHDPARIALAQKVHVVEDPGISARGANFRHMVKLTVHFADGAELSETVIAPRGSEQNFPAPDIIREKFHKLAHRLPRDHATRIAELVLNLESVPDAGELARSLAC